MFTSTLKNTDNIKGAGDAGGIGGGGGGEDDDEDTDENDLFEFNGLGNSRHGNSKMFQNEQSASSSSNDFLFYEQQQFIFNNDFRDNDSINSDIFYDAQMTMSSDSVSFNKKLGNESDKRKSQTISSENLSFDNISTLSLEELKILEFRKNQLDKLRTQEDYLQKQIDMLTHQATVNNKIKAQNHQSLIPTTTTTTAGQQINTQAAANDKIKKIKELAQYNEKCRNELSKLRHVNMNSTKTDIPKNSKINYSSIVNTTAPATSTASPYQQQYHQQGNSKASKVQLNKYSTYNSPNNQNQNDFVKISSPASRRPAPNNHHGVNIHELTDLVNKSKTWPEAELRNILLSEANTAEHDVDDDGGDCDETSNEHDVDENVFFNENFRIKKNSNRMLSKTDSFESAVGLNDDMSMQTKASQYFDVTERSFVNNKNASLKSTTRQSKIESKDSSLFELNGGVSSMDGNNMASELDFLSQIVAKNMHNDEINNLTDSIQTNEFINPVDKQIMQIKNSSNTENESSSSDGDENSSKNTDSMSIDTNGDIKAKTKDNLKKVFHSLGKAVRNVKHKANEALHHDRNESDSDDETVNEAAKTIKHRAARSNKGPYNFDKLKIVQILNCSINSNSNAIIWTMKFSPCGKLLAAAGKDKVIRIWILKSYYWNFKEIIRKYNKTDSNEDSDSANCVNMDEKDELTPFYSKPFVVYSGHGSDILDLSWSQNLFLLSASSDKTVRLWHIYKNECLCCFYHSSIISSISFHPKDDRYFVSACLGGKLRLWSIAEKKVLRWNELNSGENKNNFITAICFCQSGKTIAVGTYTGKCILYQTELLKYYSLINVRSTRGRNSKGSKITGIEVLNHDENKILITSNDSRIRLYDLRDLSLVCKYKGFANSTVHIKASLSPDDKYIISGSENKWSYIWKTNHHTSILASATGIRRDRNMYFERLQAHNSIVTSSLFAPNATLILNQLANSSQNSRHSKSYHNFNDAYCIVTAAGCDGIIKIFVNKHHC